MIVTVVVLKKILKNFFIEFPESEPVVFNDKFRSLIEEICDGFINLKIAYESFYYESDIIKILTYVSKVGMIFHNTDTLKPLNNFDFVLFMKLSRLITNFKIVIGTELEENYFKTMPTFSYKSNYKIERYICDNYKSKLEVFKIKCNEEEIQTIKKMFTCFLVKFVKLISLSCDEISLENNIELLLEVADLETLIENMHHVSNYISKDRKMIILKKITTHCIKTDYNLQNCELIKSSHEQFMLEKCSMSYFILQHVCKYLKLEDLGQSSQILSLFSIENVISPNSEIQTFYEESIKLITFKTYNKTKVIPVHKIQKCLKNLQLLFDSLINDYEHKCTQFDIVLLSILSELVIATELDKSLIMYLMDMIIDHLHIYKLPSNFIAVSYAFKIYQKLKFDNDMKMKSIDLCNSLSMNSGLRKGNQHIKYELEKVINNEENWTDILIIISYFLFNNINDNHPNNDETMNDIICKFNEHVLLISHYNPMNELLLFPFSVSLHFSLINKNENCLYNNLAILDSYITTLFDSNEVIRLGDKIYFLTVILRNYNDIFEWLPDDFLLKCWKYILDTQNMDIDASKKILLLCTSENFKEIIEMLKTKTMEIIERDKLLKNDDYFYIIQLWSSLINMQLVNKKKKVRQDHVNHFCFILNKTFLFENNIITIRGLTLLLKLVGLLLKVSWINKNTLMNCSLRIITFVEKSPSEVYLLIEATELLIVLYKCPNNYIKPYLGLYLTTFANLSKKCWSFISDSMKTKTKLRDNGFIMFHKLEKCSSLFKLNKSDFEIICRYIIEDLVNLISLRNHLPEEYMRHFTNIIYNLMDVCSHDEMQYLLFTIQGPAVHVLRRIYGEYSSIIRFAGRI